MKKRILALLIAALMALGALACAEGAVKPTIRTATYLNGGTIPTVTMEYTDPENREWIEVYLLKAGESEPNMGVIEVNGEKYSVVGIQTVDPNDPGAYEKQDDGAVSLTTDIYFGDCDLPVVGEELFLTVGLTGEDGEEALGELIPITIPEDGEAFTNAPVAIEAADGE